ncbi:MAG TPA: HEAT repeat domain-containing protein [Gemmataceae bacterium]|jgi:HEAT repeat protein
MPSSKSLCIALCLLCTALPARAGEKPNDTRGNDSSQKVDNGYIKEWGGKTFEEWRKDLRNNPDPSYREFALIALANFPQRADAVPDVVARLTDRDASPRVKAAMLLRMFPHHETDRTRIIKGLATCISHDNQSIVRYEAAHSLQFFCPLRLEDRDESAALQDLVKGLQSTSTYAMRDIIIMTLIMAGVDPKKGPDQRVTEALMFHANFQNEPTTQVRLKAIMALGAQGRPQDPKMLQRVLDVLKMPANYKSSHPTVRIWSHVAIIALVEKVDKKDLETIAGYLTDKDPVTREQAVKALGALEEKSQAYVNNILKMVTKEKVPTVRAEVAIALARMKNTGPNVLNAIISMTEEDSRESLPVVFNACQALMMMGVNSPEVMKALDKVCDHKSLEDYQKQQVKKMIEELQNPKKKPVKNAAKTPEQPVGGKAGTAQKK